MLGLGANFGPHPDNAALAPPVPQVQRERVGLLLPLSGANRALGEAMLNAAEEAGCDRISQG